MPALHPNGLYAETARPPVATPALRQDLRTDVAIVGGGFAGLSTALHLAERGVGAVVLEAREPGWGASGRNGGQVNPGLYPSPDAVVAALGREAAGRLMKFADAAPDFVFDLVRRHAIDCDAAQGGTLRAAYRDSWLNPLRDMLSGLREHGLRGEWIDADGLAAATGAKRYVGGIRYPQGGQLNPLGYARGLAEAAIAAGAKIYSATRAAGIEPHAGGWRVATAGGAVAAGHVVLATNAYTDGLWPGLAATLTPSIPPSSPASRCRNRCGAPSCPAAAYSSKSATTPSITGSMRAAGC